MKCKGRWTKVHWKLTPEIKRSSYTWNLFLGVRSQFPDTKHLLQLRCRQRQRHLQVVLYQHVGLVVVGWGLFHQPPFFSRLWSVSCTYPGENLRGSIAPVIALVTPIFSWKIIQVNFSWFLFDRVVSGLSLCSQLMTNWQSRVIYPSSRTN